MKEIIQSASVERVPAPPEKRFLTNIWHNFNSINFKSPDVRWLPVRTLTFDNFAQCCSMNERMLCRASALNVEEIMKLDNGSDVLRIRGVYLHDTESGHFMKNVYLAVIPSEGKRDEWHYKGLECVVEGASIIDFDKSPDYTQDMAYEEFRQCGYARAQSCYEYIKTDFGEDPTKDRLKDWAYDEMHIALTDGFPEVCEKYWEAFDYGAIMRCFVEGIKRFVAEKFQNQ